MNGTLLILVCVQIAQAPAVQSDVSTQRSWEIDVYAGGTSGGNPTNGSGSLPPPGPVIVESFQGVSTSVATFPTWYFGGGAAYLNGGLGRIGLRISPLDPVLTTASVIRQGGGTAGIRVGRRVKGPLRLELAAEHHRGELALTPETRAQVEASRASFIALFNGLFPTSSATSTASVHEAGSVVAMTGALTVDFFSRGRMTPFVLVGAGAASRLGDTPRITLTGRYVADLRAPLAADIAQSDNVEIRYSLPRHSPIAILGGGVRYSVSRRLVARVDAKASVSRDALKVSVEANPTTAATVPGAGSALVIFFSPPPFSLSFNSSPSGSNSLRGPALNDVVTFEGSGMQTRFSLSAGLGWRF